MCRTTLIFILLALLLMTGGCARAVEVDQTAVGAGLGVDLDDQGNLIFFAQFNRPVNAQQASTNHAQTEVFVGKGLTPIQAARNLTLVMPRFPLWSHADVFIIGEKLARTDLAYTADTMARNRNLRVDAFIMLAHQVSPYDILAGECPLSLCSSRGLVKILRLQERQLGDYVMEDINQFLIKLTTPGIDPVIPQVTVIKHGDENVLTIDGMAAFRLNRMVGSLTELESKGYRWLEPNTRRGGLLVLKQPMPGVDFVTLEVISFTSRIRPEFNNGRLSMNIDVEAYLNFYDQSSRVPLLTVENSARLEQSAAQEITRQIKACIGKAQQLNSDFLGWGRSVYRYHPDRWQTLEPNWYEILPEVSSTVNVQTTIRRTLLLDEPIGLRR